MHNWAKDAFTKSAVERIADEYKDLIQELEDAIDTVNTALEESDTIMDDLKRMVYMEGDISDGDIVTTFEQISEEKKVKLEKVIERMETGLENLEKKKEQAENRYSHYKAKIKLENTKDADLTWSEYRYR